MFQYENPEKFCNIAIGTGLAIAGGLGLLGGIYGSERERKAHSQGMDFQTSNALRNIELQREFAKHGIRWRVEDARQAGISPLAALGANVTSFSPTSVGSMRTPSYSDQYSRMGQNLGKVLTQLMIDEKKQDIALKKSQVDKSKLENFKNMGQGISVYDTDTFQGVSQDVQSGMLWRTTPHRDGVLVRLVPNQDLSEWVSEGMGVFEEMATRGPAYGEQLDKFHRTGDDPELRAMVKRFVPKSTSPNHVLRWNPFLGMPMYQLKSKVVHPFYTHVPRAHSKEFYQKRARHYIRSKHQGRMFDEPLGP